MQTTPVRARLALPIALLLGLAGCVINLNFDIPRAFTIDTPVSQGTFTQLFAVDLSQQAEVQQVRQQADQGEEEHPEHQLDRLGTPNQQEQPVEEERHQADVDHVEDVPPDVPALEEDEDIAEDDVH